MRDEMVVPGADEVAGLRVTLAEKLRELIHATVVTSATASPQQVESAARMVSAATAALPQAPTLRQYREASEEGRLYPVNPFDSPEHPLAPPVRVTRFLDGELAAEVTFTEAHEGPPGRVHGGVVAGILDHAAGLVVRNLDIVAFSVSLNIELHAATPYGEPLMIKARLSERAGRRLWVDSAVTTADARTVASCRALMIQLAGRPPWAGRAHH